MEALPRPISRCSNGRPAALAGKWSRSCCCPRPGPDSRPTTIRAGVVAHIVKPVKQSDLLEAVQRALGWGRPTRVATTWPGQAPDSPSCRGRPQSACASAGGGQPLQPASVSAEPGEAGTSVRVVANGRAALVALAEEAFDVVLMAVQMPGWMASRPPPPFVGAHQLNQVQGRAPPLSKGLSTALCPPRHPGLQTAFQDQTLHREGP